MSEAILQRLLAGKRVAIVGPSRSLADAPFGPRIDAHDVVVRMNHQWPIPPHLPGQIGTRLDILYHCCNPDYPVERIFDDSFGRTQLVCYEVGVQSDALRECCDRADVPALDVTPIYRDLEQQLGSPPNTGLVAISHLLRFPLNRLDLFGVSFYREPYYEGYPGDGAKPEHWAGDRLPAQIWRHDLEAQYRFFAEIHARDRRVFIDERTLEVFDETVGGDERYRRQG